MKFHKLAELFPLLEGNELKALAQDIAENGLREPIITYHDEILDGRNRYRACEIAKVKPTFRKYEGSNLLDFVLSANLHRRHLNESQRAMIAAKVENLEHGGNRKSNQDANLHLEKVSRVQAAEMLNVSPRLVADAVAIRNSGNEILLKKIATGEMTIHRAITESERHENIRKLNDIKNQETKKVAGVFDVIVIDPAWEMEKIERDAAPHQVGFDYPTMTLDEIRNIKIPCADDCHVFLWTTHKHLPDAFELLDYWKLKYVLTFTWHKNGGFQPFGLPQYNCEFALYARRGTPQFVELKDFMVCFNASRGKHSEKPEEFYATLRRVTAGRRLDMFSRRTIEGFESYGNESK